MLFVCLLLFFFTENNKFNYEPGNIYEFVYNAETNTKMSGASEDSAFMIMEANFEIEPITKCDFVMRVSCLAFKMLRKLYLLQLNVLFNKLKKAKVL